MKEQQVENALISAVKKHKGLCIKLVPLFFAGIPDRLVLLPNGIMFFCELKRLGKVPSPLQALVHKQIRELDFPVEVIDSADKARKTVNKYMESW